MMSENRSRQKRRNPHRGKQRSNPRRGGPGVLLTCERGREGKCRREGLEILRYYLSKQSKDEGDTKHKKLTLDEEIAMLQKQKGIDSAADAEETKDFEVYETGCGGNVLVLCMLPDSTLIPSIQTEWSEAKKGDNSAKRKSTDSNNGAVKRAKIERQGEASERNEICSSTGIVGSETSLSDESPPWDPVETVQQVLHDLHSSSTKAPSSRFVTRMIPIQATCFASFEEISLTAKALVQKYLKGSPPSTFAVNVKRRNCSTVTRDEIIDAVAGAVMDIESNKNEWKVNLKAPAYTIMVEICKTLCGMTIVRNAGASTKYRNFNLLEIRDAQEASNDKTD